MQKKAFTLVELLVGISLSMLLMISVGVFVSSGMKNIALQKQILDENTQLSSNFLELHKMLDNSLTKVSVTSSGILFKNQPTLDKGTYSYFGIKEFDKIYCSTGETTTTNHLFLTHFLPFEEIGEDINTNFPEILESQIVPIGGVNYKSDILNHQIVNSDTDAIVVGTDIFGESFSEGSIGTELFLNSPTGIVEAENTLVFSDTLNNRILYLSGGLVYSLLDESDGLNQPTGLAYDAITQRLYIANSGEGEILELSSEDFGTNPQLDISFSPESDFTANRFSIEVFTGSISISTPNSNGDFSFTNISQNITDDFQQTGNNKMDYYFVSSYGPNILIPACSGAGKILDGTDVVNCTMFGTGQLANYGTKNFNTGTSYDIRVDNISPDFTNNQNYYVKLSLKTGTVVEYEKYFPYFTQSDDDIFTGDDNSLEILASGLEYPTGVSLSGGDLLINVFEIREEKRLNVTTGIVSSVSNLTAFSDSNFNNYPEDIIIKNPVKNLEIDFPGNFLNAKLEYYKYLNCFNPDENIEKTFLLKKSF